MPKTFRLIALSLVGLAILLGILALGMGRKAPATVQNLPGETKPPAPQMIVASRDLPVGKPLTLEDLQSVDAPPGQSGRYYTAAHQVSGAIPLGPIVKGSPLNQGMFLRGLSSHVPAGERAVAVAIDDISSVGHHIQPGDYVDVFLNLDGQSNPTDSTSVASKSPLTRLLASRVRILAIGSASIAEEGATPIEESTTEETPSGVDDERARAITARASTGTTDSTTARPNSATAVLSAAPHDAATLLLAAKEGELVLTLRNPTDTAVANTDLFAPSSLPNSAPLGPDDQAYAGVSADQLRPKIAPVPGSTATVAASVRRPVRRHSTSTDARRSSGVQIIRGTDAPRPLSSL